MVEQGQNSQQDQRGVDWQIWLKEKAFELGLENVWRKFFRQKMRGKKFVVNSVEVCQWLLEFSKPFFLQHRFSEATSCLIHYFTWSRQGRKIWNSLLAEWFFQSKLLFSKSSETRIEGVNFWNLTASEWHEFMLMGVIFGWSTDSGFRQRMWSFFLVLAGSKHYLLIKNFYALISELGNFEKIEKVMVAEIIEKTIRRHCIPEVIADREHLGEFRHLAAKIGFSFEGRLELAQKLQKQVEYFWQYQDWNELLLLLSSIPLDEQSKKVCRKNVFLKSKGALINKAKENQCNNFEQKLEFALIIVVLTDDKHEAKELAKSQDVKDFLRMLLAKENWQMEQYSNMHFRNRFDLLQACLEELEEIG